MERTFGSLAWYIAGSLYRQRSGLSLSTAPPPHAALALACVSAAFASRISPVSSSPSSPVCARQRETVFAFTGLSTQAGPSTPPSQPQSSCARRRQARSDFRLCSSGRRRGRALRASPEISTTRPLGTADHLRLHAPVLPSVWQRASGIAHSYSAHPPRLPRASFFFPPPRRPAHAAAAAAPDPIAQASP